MGDQWTPGKEIAGLGPNQTYNMLQGKTTNKPIGPATQYDRNINKSMDQWIKDEGIQMGWYDIVGKLQPSVLEGKGFYDLTLPDGRQFLIQGPAQGTINSQNPSSFKVVKQYSI